MKTFYEMIRIIEDKEGLADQLPDMGQNPSEEQGPNEFDAPDAPEAPQGDQDNGELKNYMFFSNLKAIKEKVEKLLSLDVNQIDSMLEDGHDWASDHIASSKDDIEEVYNWIMGEQK